MISVSGAGSKKGFSVLTTKWIPNYNFLDKARHFELNLYEYSDLEEKDILNSNINIHGLNYFGLNEDDIIPYIYGLLNSKQFQRKYKNNLVKELPHIPLVKEKNKYVEIGRKLMEMHLNYENVPVYNKIDIRYSGKVDYQVKKMKFPKKINDEGKKVDDKSAIIFNNSITISNIPEKAYEYVVNGKSAIEWIMDQYQVKTDKKSGITDDPNDYSDDPKYIFNLLLRIINVSVQTVDLINQLPKLEIEE